MLLREEDVKSIHYKFKHLESYFEDNFTRKNYFLAACKHIDDLTDLEFINDTCPFGGIIGINNSRLDCIFRRFKIFRLHAILHDACGYMNDIYSVGPGYSYVIPCKFSSCFVGHVSGLAFCTYLKLFKNKTFDLLEC